MTRPPGPGRSKLEWGLHLHEIDETITAGVACEISISSASVLHLINLLTQNYKLYLLVTGNRLISLQYINYTMRDARPAADDASCVRAYIILATQEHWGALPMGD